MCNCKVKPPNVPKNTEWGPAFWAVLHGIGELAGRQTDPVRQNDEVRHLKNIVTTLQNILPCKECRQHLTAYIQAKPIVFPEQYAEIGPFVKDWFHTLHEDVNGRLLKPSFARENIQMNPDLKKSLTVLNIVGRRAVRSTAVSILSWKNWSNSVIRLISMY